MNPKDHYFVEFYVDIRTYYCGLVQADDEAAAKYSLLENIDAYIHPNLEIGRDRVDWGVTSVEECLHHAPLS